MDYREVRWQDDAACLGMDVNIFFAGVHPNPLALATCRRCTVQAQCLSESLKNDVEHGTWAGKARDARQKMLEVS